MKLAAPEEVGLSSGRLERIRPVMQTYIEQKKCAGVLTMIARRGYIAYLECFGMMDIEANKPMMPDTIFRIYSMSKPVTGVAAMMLYEEGKFRLKDPVSQFIPAFKNTEVFVRATDFGVKLADQKQEMTIQDLLTHTSGLSYGFDPDSLVDALYRKMFRKIKWTGNDDYLLDPEMEPLGYSIPELAKLPLAHQPGSTWHYGFSTDVAGYLIEVISGLSFDSFLRQRVFEPLNMADTGFYVSREKIGRLAAMYAPGSEGGLELIDAPAASPFTKPQNFLSGGGGLVSTASDYMRFAQMLLNQGELDGVRLLSRKTVELMTMNHLSDEVLQTGFAQRCPGYGYGLNVKVLMNVAQSGALGSEGLFGWPGIAGTDFWVDPKEELIGLIMSQHIKDQSFQPGTDFRVLTYQAIID